MLSKQKGLKFSATREIVLVEEIEEKNLPTPRHVPRIPLTMWIDYHSSVVSNPPAVTFLVNPATMSSSFTKKINTTFTRGGYVVENWGENLDVLNFTGSIGAYYVLNSTANGLNRYDRSKSYSFRNLMEVFLIYANNGARYQDAGNNKGKLISSAGTTLISKRAANSLKTTKSRILSMGDVYLQYDKTLYYGTFDNFSIEEDAGKPFSLNYDFSFTVLRRSISDNRDSAYYNQVAIEFEEYTPSARGSSNMASVVDEFIETTKNAKDQEAQTNPYNFKSNWSSVTKADNLSLYNERELEKKGITPTESQRAAYSNTFKEMVKEGKAYKDMEKLKEDVYAITTQAINNTNQSGEKSEAEINRIARDHAENISRVATTVSGK
mgnify:CR=1 FL=1